MNASRLLATVLAGALALGALLVPLHAVGAQAAATIRVSGTIASGTEGMTVGSDVQVRLIILDQSKVVEAIDAPVTDGRYSATAPLVPGRVLVPHATFQGIDYFGDPVPLTEATREATRDFRVYGTTREATGLAIASSTITVVAIDREAGQMGLLREDMVANPGDRVFVGDAATGVTLRIPAPTGTLEATGDSAEGTFAFERGVVTTTAPIRPGKLTSIVTRYVVGYDREADQYALRLTAPLPAERLTVRVPQGFVQAVRPEGDAQRAADERLTGQAEGEVLQVVQSTGAVRPGGGIVVTLLGLSTAKLQVNPLTERGGAAIASVIALAIVGGGTLAAWRWRARPA
ncbi:MAG: hypothetical protein AB7G21_08450 [Dehalococcoidia bacterium]